MYWLGDTRKRRRLFRDHQHAGKHRIAGAARADRPERAHGRVAVRRERGGRDVPDLLQERGALRDLRERVVAAVAGVVLCRLAKLPPMLGYLAVGVVIGPHAMALAKDSAGVRYLAEFGVVFLMFVIGLEFNLPKLNSMRKLVFGLGLAQVVLTIGGTLAGHFLLGWLYSFTAHPWQTGSSSRANTAGA